MRKLPARAETAPASELRLDAVNYAEFGIVTGAGRSGRTNIVYLNETTEEPTMEILNLSTVRTGQAGAWHDLHLRGHGVSRRKRRPLRATRPKRERPRPRGELHGRPRNLDRLDRLLVQHHQLSGGESELRVRTALVVTELDLIYFWS